MAKRNLRIREVAEETGLSRELIHHYLRQGLLPRSSSRAHYDATQVRLLQQIKTLRDDHHLPLETIRGVFEFYQFDPERIEAVTQAESLARRMTRLAESGEIHASHLLTADELAREAGITTERLDTYRETRLVEPVAENGHDRYFSYDAKVIALTEKGIALGMPFASFRTIGTYVRVAFALEHGTLFDLPAEIAGGPRHILGEIFARREVVTSFIQDLLQAVIARHLTATDLPPQDRAPSLDAVVYRPSDIFVRRHDLIRLVDAAHERLANGLDQPADWSETGRLMLHAGRYQEAVFLLEQALGRWPDDPDIGELYGRALILASRAREGVRVLEQWEGRGDTPLGAAYRALGQLSTQGSTPTQASATLAARQATLVDSALASASGLPDERRLEVQLLAGWLLTALPPAFRDSKRGLAILAGVDAELEQGTPALPPTPGLRERYLINAAYLLFDARHRNPPAPGAPDLGGHDRDLETLRARICRLDPGCVFAERVFLESHPTTDPRGIAT